MHKHFADWHRSAGIDIEPIGDKLPKWWAAIEKFEAARDEVVSLTQLFYRFGSPNSQFVEQFRKAFQDADPTFPMQGNDLELVVLAGAELVDNIERGPRDLADLAALSLVCSAAQNLRASPAVAEIPEIAAQYLSKRAISRAEPGKNGERGELFEGLTNAGTPYDQLAVEFDKLRLEFPIVAEESNMLWWLVSEYSRDLNQPWNKHPVSAICLVAGKELANLTKVIPGPVAALAFLDRVIRSGRTKPATPISIMNAINETPIEWRQQYMKDAYPTALENMLPINQGIKMSVTAQSKSKWPPLYLKAAAVSSSKVAPNVLAYQMFSEVLLCRSFDMAK